MEIIIYKLAAQVVMNIDEENVDEAMRKAVAEFDSKYAKDGYTTAPWEPPRRQVLGIVSNLVGVYPKRVDPLFQRIKKEAEELAKKTPFYSYDAILQLLGAFDISKDELEEVLDTAIELQTTPIDIMKNRGIKMRPEGERL
jgi:hypothetical protein